MGDRFDRLRSLVRSAAVGAVDALAQTRPILAFRDAVREIRERRTRIPERVLARTILHAGTVSSASVRTREGRIEITAELASGRVVRAALLPAGTRFAPRGAKELFFDVDPPEAAGEAEVRAMAGLIAAVIARALWAPLLPPPTSHVEDAGLVDRENGRLRIDLRTCPAVRSALASGAAASLVLEALGIERFEVDEAGLSFQIALPRLPFGA